MSPLICLNAVRTYLDYRNDQQDLNNRLSATANAVSAAVQEELQVQSSSLETLALSDTLRTSNFDAFDQLARGLLGQRGAGTILTVVSPGGTIQHRYLLSGGVSEAMASDTPISPRSGDQSGRMSGRDGFSIRVPVIRDQQLVSNLVMRVSPATIQGVLDHQYLLSPRIITVADAFGTIVARIPDQDRFWGRTLLPAVWDAVRSGGDGMARTAESPSTIAAYTHRLPFGWVVIVGEPTASANATVRAALIWLAAGAALALAAAMVFAGLAARGIVRPIERLRQLAALDAWIDASPIITTGLAEADQVAATLAAGASARHRSVLALKASEHRFRTLFERLTSGLLLADPEGMVILDCNEAAAAFAGYTVEELRGRPVLDFAKVTMAEALGVFDAVLAGHHLRYSIRIEGRVGPRNVLAEIGPVHVDGGTLVLASLIDITELRRAERWRSANEERLELACEAANLGIWDWDIENNIWSWSDYQWALHGISLDAGLSVDTAWRKAIHPMDLSRVEAGVGDALRSPDRPYSDEYNVRLQDGSTRRLLARGKPIRIRDGRVMRMVGINIDVTARYEAEKARDQLMHMIDAERKRLSEIIEALPLGVGIVGSDGKVVIGNSRMKPLMRLTAPKRHALASNPLASNALASNGPGPAARIGANTGIAAETFPDDPIERALRHGETALPGRDYLIRDHDGQERWIRVGALPLQRQDDEPREALVLFLDVDAEKRLLDIQQQVTAKLEQRVREEMDAREAAQQRAANAERIQALGQIAGGIAHDFNNILQAVSGSAALIKRRPSDPDRVARNARIVLDATKRGAAITGRLLAFARRGNLRAETIDTSALLQDIAEVLIHTLGGSVICEIDVPDRLPNVFADRGQLETVLVNLATNARDAMPGGGTLTLASEAETVPAGVAHQADLDAGHYVRITVRDTGTGMDPMILSRAMEPFFTTKELGRGTGLGLSMAKGFAEQSGGALSIESIVAEGTQVILWLPTAEGAASGQPLEWAVPAIAERPAVLLVDDDPIVREVLRLSLEDAGFRVLAAESGTVALTLLETDKADIIVSDLSMPGMDGITLIRTVQERWPGIPAVLLTGYAGDAAALAVGGAISGQFSLLRKPATGTQLVDRISGLLEAHRSQGVG